MFYSRRREQNQKFINQNKKSEYRCNPASPQTDCQEVMLTHPGINPAVSQATLSRTELYYQSTLKHPPLQLPQQGIYQTNNQMPIYQTATLPSNYQERTEMLTSTGSLNRKPTRYPGTNDCSYNEWNTVLCEKLPGAQYDTEAKMSHKPKNKKSDYKSSEGSSQVDKSDNPPTTDIIDLKLGRVNPTDSNVPQKPWNLPKKNSFNCYSRPLPPIPKT
ncbi:hypothetical protein Ahia01_000723400 [Argonauta hians]